MCIPCTTRILRCYHQRGDYFPSVDGIQYAVTPYLLQIISTKTGTMKEDDKRKRMPPLLIIGRRIYPKTITVRSQIAYSFKITFIDLLRH